MLKNKRLLSTLLVLTMVVTLFAGFGGTAAASGTVTVDVTYENFDEAGNYDGTVPPAATSANAYFYDESGYLFGYDLDIDYIQGCVDYYGLKETFYLPSGVTDPMNGEASVLDAIIVALLDYNYYNIDAGWDAVKVPNGGFINNVYPQVISTTSLYYYEGPNGNTWGHREGTGWQIATILGTYVYDSDALYFSNIPLEDGLEIVFDVSPYSRDWDTGEPWEDN